MNLIVVFGSILDTVLPPPPTEDPIPWKSHGSDGAQGKRVGLQLVTDLRTNPDGLPKVKPAKPEAKVSVL